jgi:hypothetical protein
MILDSEGLCGFIFHYACLFALTLSAFWVFLFLYKKKSLHMDEEPKYQIFLDDTRDES